MTQSSCNSSSYINLKGAAYASSSCYHTGGCSSAGTPRFVQESRLETVSQVGECRSLARPAVAHGRFGLLAVCHGAKVFFLQSSNGFAGGEGQLAQSSEYRLADARVGHGAVRGR